MKNHVFSIIGYWRRSLLDGAKAPGALKVTDLNSYWQLSREEIDNAVLAGATLSRWIKTVLHKSNKPKASENAAIIPIAYQKKAVHGQRSTSGEPEIILPLYLPCMIDEEGRVTPQTKHVPIMPRDILLPLDDMEDLAVGSMENFSKAVDHALIASRSLSDGEVSMRQYKYLGEQLLEEVSPELDAVMIQRGYAKLDHGYLLPEFQTSMAGRIIGLCDRILRDQAANAEKALPLLAAVAKGESTEKPLPDVSSSFSSRLGYPNKGYPLADNQRLVAACLLETKDGEILAVNGPPGTGKTAVLLSLVATENIRAVLEGKEYPPVIFAASTNNQAVTNILDAFGSIETESGLYERWIPFSKSFGSYYPSSAKTDGAASKGYQTALFFEQAKKEQNQAVTAYTASFEKFFGHTLPLHDMPGHIKKELERERDKLCSFEKSFATFEKMRKILARVLEDMDTDAIRQASNSVKECILHWEDAYNKRTLLEKVLFYISSSMRGTIEKRLRNVYDEYWPRPLRKAFSYSGLKDFLNEANAFRILLRDFLEATDRCGNMVHEWTGKNWTDRTLLAADRLFDDTLRRRMFWLSVHYWEARWLLEPKPAMAKPWFSSSEELENEWRLRMLLTPCAVATFHQLPGLMTVKDKPRYNFIDLLIVEEAGQVAPEIAGPSFSLAKRAVIVGDALQIEPVWSVQEPIDKANAASEGLDHKELKKKGLAASSGSIIKMAQAAAAFSQDFSGKLGGEKAKALGRGLYLVEHRRCVTPIITYCNNLCYEGILIPKKEKGPKADIPPMLGIHAQGISLKSSSGSRYNEKEARAVASWLYANKAMLCDIHKKDLSSIVGIVTPFKAQIGVIESALKSRGITGLTIGTVHALQGAEREVVIFSPVCTHHDAEGGLFFNTSPNMLNVAVSRAKENFIIIGDMSLIPLVPSSSPYGMFSQFLEFDKTAPPQDYPNFPREFQPTALLKDLAHDAFLREVLRHARRTVIIVSPWVTEKVLCSLAEEFKACKAALHVVADPRKINSDVLTRLAEIGVRVHRANKHLHAKLLFFDNHTVARGSFNWLSASRDKAYQQVEQSVICLTDNAAEEIYDLLERCGIDKNSIASA